jgi:hypothetical protein
VAKELDRWPPGLGQRPQNETKYPWDEWLNGSVWQLAQGEDYQVKTKSFRTSAQAVARKRGGRVKSAITDNGDGLVMQFIPDKPAKQPAAPSQAARDEAAKIRAWARQNGWPELGDAGRLPSEILQAYDRAQTEKERENQ